MSASPVAKKLGKKIEQDEPTPGTHAAADPFDQLRAMITGGQFMPNQRLIETDLAAELGVNRANVRLALGRLEQEGLVVRQRNRGARVRLFTDKEAIEIVESRAALEALVAHKAAERMTAANKKELRLLVAQMSDAAHSGNLMEYSNFNGRFHAAIHRIANHATATRLLSNLQSQMIRFQFRAILLPGRVDQSLKEHKAIADAICSGDTAEAERAMKAHMMQVKDAISLAIKVSARL